jgi:hypothetical protein
VAAWAGGELGLAGGELVAGAEEMLVVRVGLRQVEVRLVAEPGLSPREVGLVAEAVPQETVPERTPTLQRQLNPEF